MELQIGILQHLAACSNIQVWWVKLNKIQVKQDIMLQQTTKINWRKCFDILSV